MARMTLAKLIHKLRILHRKSADYQPLNTRIDIGIGTVHGTNSTTNLNRYIATSCANTLNHISIFRFTRKRPIKIHQVNSTCTFIQPPLCHFNRVIGKNRVILHAPLTQTNTLSVFQIDRRDDQHIEMS